MCVNLFNTSNGGLLGPRAHFGVIFSKQSTVKDLIQLAKNGIQGSLLSRNMI